MIDATQTTLHPGGVLNCELDRAPEALQALGTTHTQGKIAISVP